MWVGGFAQHSTFHNRCRPSIDLQVFCVKDLSLASDQVSWERMRAIGATVPDGSQILTELYPDFGTQEGQRTAQINLEEIVTKLPSGEQRSN